MVPESIRQADADESNKQEFEMMDKRSLAAILEHHDELNRLWREVADERCREFDSWGTYDAVKRSMYHEREIRALKMRFIPN